MDIRLVKTLPGSPDLPLIRSLNAKAFPLEERISVTYMMHGLRVPDQELLAIHADGRFAGFFSMILLGRCAYICYFAILPRLRSMGIGSAALRALAAHYPDHQVVVDFEAPDDAAPNNAIRLRRRAFYLRKQGSGISPMDARDAKPADKSGKTPCGRENPRET